MTAAENAGGLDLPSLGRGAAIGRYVVLGLVGRGAMGEVYAAYDPELDRKVAVKLLRTQVGADDLTATEAKSRLLREAQAIARLSHPNVIVVHDVGSFGDRVFVAMEFVDGHTVGYWLLAATRTWKEVLQVFMAAGHGLAAAHASQLVHRDFKVENVMVGRDGQVRVMDFGLARRVAPALSADERPRETIRRPSSVHVAGVISSRAEDDDVSATRIISSGDNPHRGNGVRVTPTVPHLEIDVDATNETGATLASPVRDSVQKKTSHPGPIHASLSTNLTHTGAIIGTPAYMAPEQFEGQPADARSDQFSFCVALYEGLYGERPFSGRTVGELSENVRRGIVRMPPETTRVPSWLRRVVLRGLRTNPAERWLSIDALLAALQKDPRVVWRRWAAIAAAVAGIAVTGLAARRQGVQESRPTCQVPPDRFAHVWESAAVPGSRRAAIAAAFERSGQPYAGDSFAGTTRLLDGYVASWSSMYTESCEATNVRGEQSAEVLDLRTSCLRDRWNEMRALSDVLAEGNGDVVVNAVKAAGALTAMDRCADVRTLRAAVPPPADPLLRAKIEALRTRLATAKALQDAGRYQQSLSATAPLVSDARATGYAPVLAEVLHRLGSIEGRMSRWNEAQASLDEAIWVAEAARYDEIVAAASIEQIYITGTIDDDMERSRRWVRQADAFLARLDGRELLRAWMEQNFGAALETQGDLEEAAARYRAALQIKERVLGDRHPDVGISLTNLAIALMTLGHSEEALELSDRGVQITEEVLGTEHPDTAVQLANRADILNHLGRFTEALRDAEHADAIWEKALGPDNVELPSFLGPLGEAYLGVERPSDAVEPLSRALVIAERNDIRGELRKLRFALARALWRSGGDRKRALQLGAMAAAPPAEDAQAKYGPAAQQRDKDLQQRAADWLAARPAERGNGYRSARRFTSVPAL